MLSTYHNHAKKKLIAGMVSLIIIAGLVVYADHAKASGTAHAATTASTSTTQTTQPPAPASRTPTQPPATPHTGSAASGAATNASGFKDGTYSATSDYYVPHSAQEIQVNLTLKDGTITDVSIQNSEGDRESAMFQERFAAAYKQYVVGKKIQNLHLGVISGASDTTQGFVDALSRIASKAQA